MRKRSGRQLGKFGLVLVVAAVSLTVMAPPVVAVPAGRSYELVSPPDDGLYDVERAWNDSLPGVPAASQALVSTPDGRHVAYSIGPGGTLAGMMPDGESRDWFVASRSDGGWSWVVPLGDRTGGGCHWQVPPQFNTLSRDGGAMILGLECSLDKRLLSPRHPQSGEPLDQTGGDAAGGGDAEQQVSTTLYRADVAADTVTFIAGEFNGANPVPRTDLLDDDYVGGSPDLSAVYFSTGAGLLSSVANSATGSYVYRFRDGATVLLTRAASGASFTLGSMGPDPLSRPNAVSVDGEIFTLTAPASRAMVSGDTNGVTDVYQVRGDEVVWVSQPTKSPPSTPANRFFEGASAAGDTVLFTTTEQMTDDDVDSQKDVYAVEVESDELTRVSTGPLNDNGDASTDGAEFVTLSDDGSRVFFLTGSQLSAEDDDSGTSLYVRNLVSETTLYVAPASSPSDSDSSIAGSLVDAILDYNTRPIRVSEGGTVAAFVLSTDVNLPAGRGGLDADTVRDLFVWREGQGLRRVRQGLGADDNTTTLASVDCKANNGLTNVKPRCRGMSGDGELVFFQTTDSLVPEDADGGHQDVYALRTVDGSVELFSPAGEAPIPSVYVDNSVSGDDVFFETAETLDPSRDIDLGRRDLYNVHLGEPIPPLVDDEVGGCVGDLCQAPPSAVPARPGVGSGVGAVSDDVVLGARPRIAVSALGRAALRRAARRGVLGLRVRTNLPGTVTGVARAALPAQRGRGTRRRRVASGSERAAAAGRVVLRLRLSEAARGQLRSRGRLRLSVRVELRGASVRSRTVVLRMPRERSGGGARRGR